MNHIDTVRALKFDRILYHKGCPDGNAAAWVLWNIVGYEKDVFIPMDAGKYPEEDLEVDDMNILMLDVSGNRKQVENIAKVAKNLVIVDHHKSALDDLKDLNVDNVFLMLDMDRSGCQLAWDIFAQGARPWFIDVIADRDLWKWKIENSKELGSFMFSNGYYYDWNKMSTLMSFTGSDLDRAVAIGSSILDNENKQADNIVKYATPAVMNVGDVDYKIYVASCPHSRVSEVGDRIMKKYEVDFAVMYRYSFEDDSWWISCRTNKNDVDLSVITRMLNGGGHQKAAGFTVKNSAGVLQEMFKKV